METQILMYSMMIDVWWFHLLVNAQCAIMYLANHIQTHHSKWPLVLRNGQCMQFSTFMTWQSPTHVFSILILTVSVEETTNIPWLLFCEKFIKQAQAGTTSGNEITTLPLVNRGKCSQLQLETLWCHPSSRWIKHANQGAADLAARRVKCLVQQHNDWDAGMYFFCLLRDLDNLNA